jgi:hypothetical protein
MNEYLLTAIEHAPLTAKTNPELAGFAGSDFIICAHCAARIMARGCSLPKPNRILWKEYPPSVECDLIDFH